MQHELQRGTSDTGQVLQQVMDAGIPTFERWYYSNMIVVLNTISCFKLIGDGTQLVKLILIHLICDSTLMEVN